MALSANTVWEVRNSGADTNGGGFVTGSGGTDYSQQDAAQLSVTDAACAGNTTLTSATGGFTSAMVGSIVYLSSGPGWYQITAHTDTNTVTIDRNGPNATGMTANVGGAFATPTKAVAVHVASNTIWIKSGTYTQTALLTLTAGAAGARTRIFGYNATRGDLAEVADFANFPILQNNNTTNSVLSLPAHSHCGWLVLDGGSGGSKSERGLAALSDWSVCENMKAINWTVQGFQTGSNCIVRRCLSTLGVSGADSGFVTVGNTYYEFCVSADNPCKGFRMVSGTPPTLIGCISYGHTGGSGRGFSEESTGSRFYACVAYDCSQDGICLDGGNAGLATCIHNCILAENGGYGINSTSTNYTDCPSDHNAFYSNTSGLRNNWTAGAADVTLSADPFTDGASGDFSLNATAGGGADCRAAGFPGEFPGGLTTGYLDIGAVQHQDAGGGGGMLRALSLSGGLI